MADTKTLKGTQTEKILAASYVAESTAVTRYTFYSQAAQKEGFYQYANILAETAANELRHAKIFLKYLQENAITPGAVEVDLGVIGKTVDNLKIAAHEEQVEGVDAYQKAAKIAEEEGFTEIAGRFRAIASVESHHEARFNKLIDRIENGTVWKSEDGKPIKWQCLVCGYIYEGVEPPAKCPACAHPMQHFQRMEDNY
ncbi:MAG: rubrerythrin family protein [Clostridium sp.]|nr:rubrerythrin family protein [Prevotella sp.]MCM1428896.1 rubrerythrin family protein [Clostridium sp.]MCM1475275.1 rubrerythrin family protein [Muribaculaceae bacterium]